MINVPFESIDKEFIQQLLKSKVAESKYLDYKEKIHSKSDKDVKDFLADIASFANTSGGLIIYGIPEERNEEGGKAGQPGKVTGVDGSSCDDCIRRIESQIRDGIAPKLTVQTKAIKLDEGRTVIVVKIPQSFSAPHMVTFKKSSQFYARSSTGKHHLDVQEIRHAFLGSESLPERIRQFRVDRLAKIEADETPAVLPNKYARLALHLVPLSSFAHQPGSSLLEINSDTKQRIQQIGYTGSWDYNFDGIYNYIASGNNKADSYCQVFRNGVIESVKIISRGVDSSDIIPAVSYERNLIDDLKRHIRLYKEIGNELPMFLMASVLRTKNVQLGVGSSFEFSSVARGRLIDRDSLIMTEIFIDNFDAKAFQVLRPIFDSIWQACGYEGSANYDKDGRWHPIS